MGNVLQKEIMSKIASFNGIDVYRMKTTRFKTNTINIFLNDNLTSENASKNAIIPAILRRGCKKYPTSQDIALYLEELYGASFDCGIAKKGERQIIQFYIEYIADDYVDQDENLFEKTFDLLYEIITDPVIENGSFKQDYIEQEKENLKKLIESRVNDKTQYAVERCFEEMCREEPFGVYEYGSAADLDKIDFKKLLKYYETFLETCPIQVYITGNIDDSKIKKAIEKLYGIKRTNTKVLNASNVYSNKKEVRNVTEKMSVTQGKLSLGFRTNIPPNHDDYYTLIVYNGILGGGIHSKLFQNVREKESLAYYAFSRLEKFKGLMIISSGIEIKNKDKALGIILQQLDEIKAGNISDYEFTATFKTIETGIKSLKDSQLQIVDFYLSQAITNTDDDLDTIIEKVKKVSKQDVINIADKIDTDTVYFLTSSSQ